MAKKKSGKLLADSTSIDATLDALFATSSGPVQAPPKSRYSALLETGSPGKAKPGRNDSPPHEEKEDKDDELSSISQELGYNDEDQEDCASSVDSSCQDGSDQVEKPTDASVSKRDSEEGGEVQQAEGRRDRKRKRKDGNDDLEARYLAELTKIDDEKPLGKRQKSREEDAGASDADDACPLHESLTQESKDSDFERASRTVFLSNVSTEAIFSKAAKRTLLSHLTSALDLNEAPEQKFESIRFRSVAFSTGSMPKRAAYITKSLMNATTRSANAYVVFSTAAAARQVTSKLNGTEVLGRHLRVDSVAHPSPTDHRRCVFVGNLGFIDDETVIVTNEEGEKVEKKRTKVPADAEEGLWRTFGKVGKVESVRVVRDAKTRVGKGFAYVQFYDANDVEAALLLNEKKFPPMLPRKLRVTRAKDPRKTALAQERTRAKAQAADRQARSTKYTPKLTPAQQAAAGRANRLLGRGGGFMHRKQVGTDAQNGDQSSPKPVFEGKRASSKDGRPKDLKFGKGKKSKGGGPKSRSARRAAEWKKS
ncbi:uncharacterized protein UV8b_02077 [Ustilaginoidea virens]|uniref:Nucleolar protein 12 n=1 Tax=Ustilaginoidea virens TaxID=1159556 RepID=A0A8E5MF71_USTVR|nr:uncharacterized protein UV8b_02077 [Ustilaginoidea virens]QUC17836.1 hypothetical protein UV8b_02077 [Ustilaginoidea virens]